MRLPMLALFLLLTACAVPVPAPVPSANPAPRAVPEGLPSPQVAADNFATVVARVEPVAERLCRERTTRVRCDFQIVVDTRFDQPPNAFQTVDEAGRPFIAFSIALIAEARNQDELAFILGHEAAHHIRGHLPRTQETALRGAILAGVLASIGGAGPDEVRTAQNIGATVGARTYSKDFELEADALGTIIAFRAGYDPVLGAQYFQRIDDPGNMFLGSHPPNAARIEIVQRTVEAL